MITRNFPAMVLKSGDQVVRVPIRVELAWDGDNDPLAVQLIIIQPGDDEKVWFVGRELLQEGTTSSRRVGTGDVGMKFSGRVNGRESVYVCFKNPSGHADIALPYHDVVAFLEETAKRIPIGEECLDTLLDEAIEEILADG